MKSIMELKEAFKSAFATKDGQIVMEDLEQRFHIKTPTFVPDSNEAAYKEGQRSVVLFIHNMLAEYKEREDVVSDE